MTKPKFDLKNVGGQPKKWTDGSGEIQSDKGWLEDLWMALLGFGLPLFLLVSAAASIYGLFKILSKLA